MVTGILARTYVRGQGVNPRPRPAVPKAGGKAGAVCKTCQTIRRFLYFAGVLLVLMWAQPDWRLPPDYDYSTLVGDAFLAVFLAVFGWKYYQYRKDQREEREAQALREARQRELTRSPDDEPCR